MGDILNIKKTLGLSRDVYFLNHGFEPYNKCKEYFHAITKKIILLRINNSKEKWQAHI